MADINIVPDKVEKGRNEVKVLADEVMQEPKDKHMEENALPKMKISKTFTEAPNGIEVSKTEFQATPNVLRVSGLEHATGSIEINVYVLFRIFLLLRSKK